MSSVFEVPQQLALAIMLAATPAGPGALPGALPLFLSLAPPVALAEPQTVRRRSQEKLQIDFRFAEQSWLRAVKEARGLPGIGGLSRRIFKTSSGRHYVPIEAERQRILALRRQSAIAFRVAFDYARRNLRRIEPMIGRGATAGELYIAHLIGADATARLIALAERSPGAVAATQMGAVAFDYRELFLDVRRPVTAGEIYSKLTRAFGGLKNRLVAARQAERLRRKKRQGVASLAGLDWAADVRAAQ